MRLLFCRYQKSHHRPIRAFRRALIAIPITLACLALGCSETSKGTNANLTGSTSKSGGNDNANAGSRTASSQSSTIDIKVPERYGVAMTISTQGTVSEAPAPMLTQQLSLAKVGADRRWTFVFPAPVGQIVYLEKSGLKYLVLVERKQYVELTPDALGFQLGSVLTPNSIAERLGSRQYEKLGLEPVNGRTAIKYRLSRAVDTSTQIDGVIFVDQETGLPLRSELNTSATVTKSRVIVEVRDVQLNPNPAQFDVPAGMKKVTQQEARQQVETFASAVRPFADIISGTPSAPVARANQSAANKNGGRRGR